jgi:hypothetical protein
METNSEKARTQSASQNNNKETTITWLALLTSSGTLLCCALPIALVTFGMGATLASFVSSSPILISLSQNKTWVFAMSGLLLALSAWLLYRPNRICPKDPELAQICSKTHLWNRRIYWFSVSLWAVGFFAAFLALPLQIWLDS